MARARKAGSPLRLVVTNDVAKATPPILESVEARQEFAELTQALVDIVIEINDLLDGDADREPNGDEFEEDDGI